jgi:hypothetical protein
VGAEEDGWEITAVFWELREVLFPTGMGTELEELLPLVPRMAKGEEEMLTGRLKGSQTGEGRCRDR